MLENLKVVNFISLTICKSSSYIPRRFAKFAKNRNKKTEF